MKKKMLLFAAVALLGCGMANAQDEFGTGKWAIETEVIPNAVGTDWFVPNLTLGYTLNNGDQVYASFEINTNRFNGRNSVSIPARGFYTTDAAFDDAMEDYEHAIKEFERAAWGDFTLGLGYQHYFVKEGRFRPFINGGIDLVFGWANMASHAENYSITDNKWYTEDITYRGYYSDGINEHHKGFGFEFDLGLGFDFYIYKNLYIGAELGLSYDMYWDNNYSRHYVTDNPAVAESQRDLTRTWNVKGFESEGYQWVTPMIRVGWHF